MSLRESSTPEPAYSLWREVRALLWACMLAGLCLVTLYYAVPWIAVLAGGQ